MMAIAHFRSKFIGQGVSPIAAAAYRHRTSLHDAAIGQTFSYAPDKDLVHAELAIPGNTPQWFRDLVDGRTPEAASEALWNAILDHEKRADAQYAREIVIALPLELSRQENIALVQDYVASEMTSRGFVVDWVFHDKPGNPHAHLMHTLRPLGSHGFGPKRIALRDEAGLVRRDAMGGIQYRHFAGTRADFVAMRQAWGEIASRHLAAAGHDVVVDMRSFADRGIAAEPTTHLGPAVSGLRRNRRPSFVGDQLDWENADRIRHVSDNPGLVLELITQERSTFGDVDIARVLNRFVDDPDTFQNLLATVKGASELLVLRPDLVDPESGHTVAAAIYSTRTMVALEHRMAATAALLQEARSFSIGRTHVVRAMASVEGGAFKLTDEQLHAVHHVTGSEAIAAIVGRAGTGKSTLLKAANAAWTAAGQRVFGAALAGKAAEALETSSGIPSRTIASWQQAWMQGRDRLQKGDVLVLDEAGMVSSRQMAALVSEVHAAGAKLVLVGDPEQLQPIEAGAAFRAIVERIGFAELSEVRRQTVPWMQAASRDLASGHAARALRAYQRHNALETLETKSQAIELLVHHWNAARVADGSATLLALAHSNADVLAINAAIRDVRTERGALADPIPFATARGMRTFAIGDRVLFLENRRLPSNGTPDATIAVKNGSLGSVTSTASGSLTVAMDAGGSVRFDAAIYPHIDHGYAATIHKAQGATVDHAFVLASPGMDRHLAYVAFSRHRQSLTIYAPQETLGHRSLADIVSRSGAKTTSLDYADPASLAAIVRRRGGDALSDWVDVVRARLSQMRVRLIATAKRLHAFGMRVGTVRSAPLSSERAANPQQRSINRNREQQRTSTPARPSRAREQVRLRDQVEAIAERWRAGKRKAVHADAPRVRSSVGSAGEVGLESNKRDDLSARETISTPTANISIAAPWINADVRRQFESRITGSAWRALTSQVSRMARRQRGSDTSPSTTAKEISPYGTSPMQPNIEHSKLEIEGSTARISFNYDKTANETFLRVVGSGKAQFQEGAWQIKLPDDERQRDTALGKIELAQRSIEPRLKDMALSQTFSEEIAARHPQSTEVEVSARNSALAVRIPPVQEAIKELKALGAHWIPKNEKTEAGGYWRLAIKDATHATVVSNKLGEIEGHVRQEAQSTSAAKSIVSPHSEISVATAGNTIFVSTPHMTETNAILKAEGPGAMRWDSGARAYAVKVDTGDGTAQNPGNVGEIRQRLDAVADFYQTKTLVPPHEGRPGLAHPTEAEQQLLARANPETYARDSDVQRFIDKLNDRVTTALSEEDRRAITAHRPGEAIQSDRLAQLPTENVEAAAKLVQHAQSVQSQGVTQQLEQARGQIRSATLSQ